MPRRPSQKTDNRASEDGNVDIIATPKKGRKTVKVEETEVIPVLEAKSVKKGVNTGSLNEGENAEQLKNSAEVKINRVKAQAALAEETNPKSKKSSIKRKKAAKDEEDEEDDEDASEKKVIKKRKTKEEKEAEAMPLAARTLVGGLKKAMYIGAHVSGAGGMF
jgi:AP endonuclease-1